MEQGQAHMAVSASPLSSYLASQGTVSRAARLTSRMGGHAATVGAPSPSARSSRKRSRALSTSTTPNSSLKAHSPQSQTFPPPPPSKPPPRSRLPTTSPPRESLTSLRTSSRPPRLRSIMARPSRACMASGHSSPSRQPGPSRSGAGTDRSLKNLSGGAARGCASVRMPGSKSF